MAAYERRTDPRRSSVLILRPGGEQVDEPIGEVPPQRLPGGTALAACGEGFFVFPGTDLREAGVHLQQGRTVLVGGADYITYKVRSAETDGAYFCFEASSSPGFGPPLHSHEFDETFYILDGELTFQLKLLEPRQTTE